MNRQDLKDYRNNKQWVEIRKESIIEEYEGIQKLTATYGYNAGGSSEVQDRLAENLAKLLDMKMETLDYAIRLEVKLQNIDNKLKYIEQPYRNILTFVYVEGKTLVEVANELSYSYVQVCRNHGIALKKWDNLKDDMK